MALRPPYFPGWGAYPGSQITQFNIDDNFFLTKERVSFYYCKKWGYLKKSRFQLTIFCTKKSFFDKKPFLIRKGGGMLKKGGFYSISRQEPEYLTRNPHLKKNNKKWVGIYPKSYIKWA